MSTDLIDQIREVPNICVEAKNKITAAYGKGKLELLDITDLKTRKVKKYAADALFIFIGAKPFTEWIELDIIKDSKG